MNWDQIEGNWKQLKGKVRQQWGKLTDDNLDVINGRREMLAGQLQESYGITRDEAARQIKEWQKSFDVSNDVDEDDDAVSTDNRVRQGNRR
jgi:uncharacterized protein YjbJ (UPF0337 family)